MRAACFFVSVALGFVAACAPGTGPVTRTPATVTIGLSWDVDPSISFEVDVTLDGRALRHDALVADGTKKYAELDVSVEVSPGAKFEVHVVGKSPASTSGPEVPVVDRVVRASVGYISPHLLLPVIVDGRCVRPMTGKPSAFDGCTAGTTCAAGRCIEAAATTVALQYYTPDWRFNDTCGVVTNLELEVGRMNLDTFVPFADGDKVAPDYGPQGGRHIDVAIRAKGFYYRSASLTISATPISGTGPLPQSGHGMGSDLTTCSGGGRWILSNSTMAPTGTYDVTFALKDASGSQLSVVRRLELQ